MHKKDDKVDIEVLANNSIKCIINMYKQWPPKREVVNLMSFFIDSQR